MPAGAGGGRSGAGGWGGAGGEGGGLASEVYKEQTQRIKCTIISDQPRN